MKTETISSAEIESAADLPKVPILVDVCQERETPRMIPEIRVWCHKTSGDDYYEVFDTFIHALDFIASDAGKQLGCEDQPLIAFRGFEINIWDLPQLVE